jgi:hypothetical protein
MKKIREPEDNQYPFSLLNKLFEDLDLTAGPVAVSVQQSASPNSSLSGQKGMKRIIVRRRQLILLGLKVGWLEHAALTLLQALSQIYLNKE